jgi:plastocyanin
MRSDTYLRVSTLSGSWMVAVAILFSVPFAGAQDASVSGQIEILESGTKKPADAVNRANVASSAVVWLVPLGDNPGSPPAQRSRVPGALLQRNKSFDPHVLIIEVGATVQFPNKDPFFHNVFSLFDGKRFDLGLYESGSSNSVRFDRPGISFLFCNIHPEMSAVVIAVPTPYYAISDAAGRWTISSLPNGRYRLHVWYERSSQEKLAQLQRDIVLSDANRALETIRVPADAAPNSAHKNKYGKDYVPPGSSAYSNP